MNINSDKVIYSEHDVDECFEYKDGRGRVPDGIAVGYLDTFDSSDKTFENLILFDDTKYSQYDHDYWDNYELENDINRVVLP